MAITAQRSAQDGGVQKIQEGLGRAGLVNIKELARVRIAEAEAAIAAAEKSAMSAYQEHRFQQHRDPALSKTPPWISQQQDLTPLSCFKGGSFAERLKTHEAHLNALRQVHHLSGLPSSSDTTSDTNATATKARLHATGVIGMLPPWSRPPKLPSFPVYSCSGKSSRRSTMLKKRRDLHCHCNVCPNNMQIFSDMSAKKHSRACDAPMGSYILEVR
jgi:hypothetical protein